MKSTVWSFDNTEPECEWEPWWETSPPSNHDLEIVLDSWNCAGFLTTVSLLKEMIRIRANCEDRHDLVGHSTILDWTSCILTLYCRTHSKKLSGFNFLEFTFKKDGQKRFFIKSKYKFLLNRNLWLSHHGIFMKKSNSKAYRGSHQRGLKYRWTAQPTSQSAASRIFCIS